MKRFPLASFDCTPEMTKRTAESIMKMTVTITEESRGFKAEASDKKHGARCNSWAPTKAQALSDLVFANYRRICWMVATQQRHRCASCRRQIPLQFHHKIHRARGQRLDTEENIEGLCVRCHGAEHGQKVKE